MTIKELYEWAEEHKITFIDIACIVFTNGQVMLDDTNMSKITSNDKEAVRNFLGVKDNVTN